MKIKRYKRFQRVLKFYQQHFSLQPPYSVFVDGTFAKAVLDGKINMRDQLPKYMGSEVTFFTSSCALVEIEKLGPELYGAVQILKSLKNIKCSHSDPIPASKCILSLVSQTPSSSHQHSKTQYIIATQDIDMKKKLKSVPNVPIISLFGTAPELEKPSPQTEEYVKEKNFERMGVVDYQKEILVHMKKEVFGESSHDARKGTKKRKRKGPNPLSCKKSRKAYKLVCNGETPKKRKRVRKRLPAHVKAELKLIREHLSNSTEN